ncbi:MAG: PQQ-binding-like beta-propeller repeat protein [Acidobacteriota bacterium]
MRTSNRLRPTALRFLACAFVALLSITTNPALADTTADSDDGITAARAPAQRAAVAADWPQFRGKARDGVARGIDLATSWPEVGPPEAFRQPIGDGFSGIAALGDRLYTMAAEGELEVLLALDRRGRTLWRLPVGSRFVNEFGDGPRSTPTVADGTVYAASADMRLVAVDAADGSPRWTRDLRADFGARVPRFGFSPSALVIGDLLVLEVGGGEGRALAAFDRATGETRWTALDGGASSSSPLAVTIDGIEQIVVHRRPELVGLSLDGEILWRHESAPDAIVMPLFVPPDGLYVSSAAMGDGGMLVRVNRGSQGWTVEEAWTQRRMRNHFNTAVHLDGAIYGFDNATLRCVDAGDGSPCWAARGFGKGSLIAGQDSSGDGVLFVYSDDGELALIEATRDEYRERGRVQATEGRSWTAPTLAGDLLLVRDHDELVAYHVGADLGASDTRPARADSVRRADAARDRSALGELSAEAVAARYAEARGGLEAWAAVDSLRITGTYATFSVPVDFTLIRGRGEDGDRYRIDHAMLGAPFVRGRDAEGLWWMTPLFGANEGAPLGVPTYQAQLEREALFAPPLLTWSDAGLSLELLGPREVDGEPTIALELTWPQPADAETANDAEGEAPAGPWTETWHLDPETWLEVAIDTPEVADATQGPALFPRRTYLGDFRRVGALVVPHKLSHEFGARLEEIEIDSVEIDPKLPADAFDRAGARVEETND